MSFQTRKRCSFLIQECATLATGPKRRRLVHPHTPDDSSVIAPGLNETSCLRGQGPSRRSFSPVSASLSAPVTCDDNQWPSGAIRRSKRTSTDAPSGKDSAASKMTSPKLANAAASAVSTPATLSNTCIVAKKGKPSNLVS